MCMDKWFIINIDNSYVLLQLLIFSENVEFKIWGYAININNILYFMQ